MIIGASIAGLSAGLLLARDGHDVTVLDRDDVSPGTPDHVAATAHRTGAPHAVQAHAFLALARMVLRDRLPDVLASLYAQGAVDLPLPPPPSLAGHDVPNDPGLVFLMVRRPIAEWALRDAASRQHHLEVRVGTTATGLRLDESGVVPRVTGLHLDSGEVLDADLVVDASGRRSMTPRWLTGSGMVPVIRSEPCGLMYFGRSFRVRPGVPQLPPLNRGFGAGAMLPRFGALLIPSERGHVNVALNALTTDQEMKAVRSPAVFDSVLRSLPTVSPWLDVMEPTSEVVPFGGLQSTLIRLVSDSGPIVHGLHLIGDACSTTNPTFARGLSWALAHAAVLRDVVIAFPFDLSQQATSMDAWIARELEPFYDDAITSDGTRRMMMAAAVRGEAPVMPPGGVSGRPALTQVLMASFSDPFVWHRLSRFQSLLAKPSDLYDDPEIRARVAAVETVGLPAPVGPTNEELAVLLT